jgi:hypothetical protein
MNINNFEDYFDSVILKRGLTESKMGSGETITALKLCIIILEEMNELQECVYEGGGEIVTALEPPTFIVVVNA